MIAMIQRHADRGGDTRITPPRSNGWGGEVVGATNETQLLDGSAHRFVNLDNAATTPALVAVQQAVLDYLPWYSSVHRGAGFKSRLSTAIFEEARAAIGACLGIDATHQEVIFVKYTPQRSATSRPTTTA